MRNPTQSTTSTRTGYAPKWLKKLSKGVKKAAKATKKATTKIKRSPSKKVSSKVNKKPKTVAAKPIRTAPKVQSKAKVKVAATTVKPKKTTKTSVAPKPKRNTVVTRVEKAKVVKASKSSPKGGSSTAGKSSSSANKSSSSNKQIMEDSADDVVVYKGKVDDFAKEPFLPDEEYGKIFLSLLNQELKVSTSMMNLVTLNKLSIMMIMVEKKVGLTLQTMGILQTIVFHIGMKFNGMKDNPIGGYKIDHRMDTNIPFK